MGTFAKLGLMLMTFCALQTSVAAEQIGRGKAKTQEEQENDQLGQIVQEIKFDKREDVNIPGYTTHETHVDEDGTIHGMGELDASYQPVLPFTEYQKQRKTELEGLYGEGKTLMLEIDSIEPSGGPTTGETRVLVRGGPFEELDLLYPNPVCKFGSNDRIVKATYVKCTQKPKAMEDLEGKNKQKDYWCLQCDNSPAVSKAMVVPLMISLKGDFSDSQDSEPFRYYLPTVVDAIYPRYGPKDGGTVVQVWGKNFLNYGENLKCNFGSKSVTATFKSSTYLICSAPFSDVVNKPITFSVSMNKQQNSRQLIDYWYYSAPLVAKLDPNYGPDVGGNNITFMGSNMHPFIDETNINNANDTFCVFWDLNQKKMPATLINATKLVCEAPPSINDISVTGVDVTLNNQNYTDDDVPYYYYKPPKVYYMIPPEGPTKGGTDVRIFATEFKMNKHIICIFGETKTRGKHISKTEIECISPPHQPPEKVQVYVTYEEDGDKSKSNGLPFLYYETPELISVEPPCGPTYGRTQITLKGRNFVDMGFNRAFCIFNGTRWMNTTIVDSETIICQTPSLSRFETFMTQRDMVYHITITLNAHDQTSTYVVFRYYHELEIQQVLNSPEGPISGNTKSTLIGRNFNQTNVCNRRVKYGTIEVTPVMHNDTCMEVVSPRVSDPGAVVLFPSGNAQNYAKDWILHYRDIENTFTYYQDMFVHDLHPQAGPTTGNTRLEVTGIGFKQFKYDNGTLRDDMPLYVKFVDQTTGAQIGEIGTITDVDNDAFIWHTPKAKEGTKAILELSFNKQNWQQIIPTEKSYSYLYYNAPIVTSIDPHFGPVKAPNDETAIIYGLNFVCPQNDCSKVTVRFGDYDYGTYVPGTVLSSTSIQVHVPKYTKPDILQVEISMNGKDYTNDRVTYGFFDAFVLSVNPRLVVKRGGTKLTVRGFGFVNSEASQLKSKFRSKAEGDLYCNQITPCIVSANFIDKNTMTTESLPQSTVKYADGTTIGTDGFTVDVSVYGGQFTDNKIEVYYIYDPEYLTINRQSVPRNLQVPLLIETNFFWDNNNPELFFKYANFTCKSTIGDEVKVTQGRMESLPIGTGYGDGEKTVLPTHIICPSAKMTKSGIGKIQISPNGMDYTTEGFTFEYTEPTDIFRIAPQSGPKEFESKVKLIGGGFKQSKETVYAKIGNFDLEPIAKDQIVEKLWNQVDYLGSMLMNKDDLRMFRAVQTKLSEGQGVQTVWSRTPNAPTPNKTPGGPVFVTAGQVIKLDIVSNDRRLKGVYTSSVSLTQEPAPGDVADTGSVTLAQNVITETDPAAKATSTKTSRTSTSSKYTVAPQTATKPADRYIFTESPIELYYYHNPVVKKVQPTTGLAEGGTPVEISGAWFDEKLEYGVIPYCMIGDKIIRGRFWSTVRIVCQSPPSDILGVSLPVKVSLNGVDFVDSGFTFSYYVQPELISISPKSGPMTGGTDIFIKGTQFSNITDSENVKCRLSLFDSDRVIKPKTMPVVYINETYVMCMSPNGFKGGEKAHIQLTFNDNDYTPISDNIVFRYYALFDSFPKSGPADGFDQTIVVKGAGLTSGEHVMCSLNKTEIKPVNISDNIILCPMCLPDKDPEAIGSVNFGVKFDNTWNEFGDFYYYKQITFESMSPNFGPSEGEGLITMTGQHFRNDFPGVEIGCRVGESIGKGYMTEEGVMKCIVEEMDLVDMDEALVAQIALNSYSWVGAKENPFLYRPYGITQMQPSSGPYDGFTDVLITGKGFTEEIAANARCKFGVDLDHAIIEADVIDYNRLTCRSPQLFQLPEFADETISVPFGIAFGDEENNPWTMGTWRYRFYVQPSIARAVPEEVRIGRFAEIYLYPYEGERFFEPLPSGRTGDTTGILCSFEDFGTSMGLYINETAILCITPHIKGRPEDYYRETVQVTIAMNGQDFNEIQSDAYVTFIGTGEDSRLLFFLIAVLLIALLILALIACCTSMIKYFTMKLGKREQPNLEANVVSLRDGSGSTLQRGSLGSVYRLDNASRASRPGSGRSSRR